MLVHHFAGQWVMRFPIGVVGVRLFFVLSGYLITGILLDHRDSIEKRGHSFGSRLLQFYGRRMLRLLPVLYVAVAALTLFNLGIARQSWPWDLSYLSNFYAMKIHRLAPAVGHFWTLAIEEQFYVVWPWIILLTPRRWLGSLILSIILVAPIFRLTGTLCYWHWTVIYCMPIGAWDALGLGALLIFAERERPHWREAMRLFRILALMIATPLSILGLLLMYATLGAIRNNPTWSWAMSPVKYYRQDVTDSMLALFGFGVLGMLRACPAGWAAKMLRWRPLVYLGTISYGMYVYHIPFKQFYEQYVEQRFPALPQEGSITYFFFMSAITIVLAAISWHFIEKPIGRLKRFLPERVGAGSGPGRGLGGAGQIEREVDVNADAALHERPAGG